jgi:hypothetical protein
MKRCLFLIIALVLVVTILFTASGTGLKIAQDRPSSPALPAPTTIAFDLQPHGCDVVCLLRHELLSD